MIALGLAARNVLRNRRRSFGTALAIMVSCGGLILFGGYVVWTFRSVECQTVGTYGHLQISKTGYYERGAGDPTAFAISGYEDIVHLLRGDSVLGPMIDVVSGRILFNGLVSSEAQGTSTTFYGLGVFPGEDKKITYWNPYGIFSPTRLAINAPLFAGIDELDDADTDGGSVGGGLSKILGLERPLPFRREAYSSAVIDENGVNLSALVEDNTPEQAVPDLNAVELLAATPGGALPNVATMRVRRVFSRATKELDDQLIKLHIRQASGLLFPGEELKVTTIPVLLKRTADTPAALQRVREIIASNGLDLEVKTWDELRPFYRQLTRMFDMLFVFMFCIIAMIVMFTIYNTVSTSIVERTEEIGTLRAIGTTRAGILSLFLLEGALIGVLGGGLGVVFGIVGDLLINRVLEVVYIPPGVSFYAKLEVMVLRTPWIMGVCFAGSVVTALISSYFPARRAARLPIVQALHQS